MILDKFVILHSGGYAVIKQQGVDILLAFTLQEDAAVAARAMSAALGVETHIYRVSDESAFWFTLPSINPLSGLPVQVLLDPVPPGKKDQTIDGISVPRPFYPGVIRQDVVASEC